MARLRAPDGCPWDREQTLESLKKYVIEEAYEVCDAIDSGSPEGLREELGDLLLQVAFQSQIASERGWFDHTGVVDAISDKMERRHPHVFGEAVATTAEEVARAWEARKAVEKAGRGPFDGIPKALPPLSKATTVLHRLLGMGAALPGGDDPLGEALTRLGTLRRAAAPTAGSDRSDTEAARVIGAALLLLTNASRQLGVDASAALDAAVVELMAAHNGPVPIQRST